MKKKMLAPVSLSHYATWDYRALVIVQWLKRVIFNY